MINSFIFLIGLSIYCSIVTAVVENSLNPIDVLIESLRVGETQESLGALREIDQLVSPDTSYLNLIYPAYRFSLENNLESFILGETDPITVPLGQRGIPRLHIARVYFGVFEPGIRVSLAFNKDQATLQRWDALSQSASLNGIPLNGGYF